MENNGQVPTIVERDRYRKQLTFDIDTKTLEIYYPKANWRHGYDDIRGFLKREGFDWCEGTVYVSKKPLESYEVTRIVRDLVKRYPWLNKCMRDCRQANIGRQHSLNYIFSKNAKVPTREELNASKDPHSAKKRSTGPKKKTPDQMKLHNFFEMNVMER